MKYAHLADLHLGSWREDKIKNLSIQAFLNAADNCIQQKVDFILFVGDLFNTSLPSLDTLKIVTKKLKELKDNNIPIYAIAGSHDFSPSGKTMLDVLENAGLLINVCKGFVDQETKKLKLIFTEDQKTGAKITGMLGKKGLLDKVYYQDLDLENLETEKGYKIFLFHTTITELKPEGLDFGESQPVSFLPKSFHYYAGGHLHHPTKIEIPEYGVLTYPGALFPNNFAELEKYSNGGYYLITVDDAVGEIGGTDSEDNVKNNVKNKASNYSQQVEWIPLEIMKHQSLIYQCQHQTPEEITKEIISHFSLQNIKDCLITIRLKGTLENGTVSEINFKQIFDTLYEQGAYFIMKNTAQLNSKEFAEIKTIQKSENFEEEIIKEHLQQIKTFDYDTELFLTKSLLNNLNTTKKEGETITDFQTRVIEEINQLLNLEAEIKNNLKNY